MIKDQSMITLVTNAIRPKSHEVILPFVLESLSIVFCSYFKINTKSRLDSYTIVLPYGRTRTMRERYASRSRRSKFELLLCCSVRKQEKSRCSISSHQEHKNIVFHYLVLKTNVRRRSLCHFRYVAYFSIFRATIYYHV
jgi:hypothetical protein